MSESDDKVRAAGRFLRNDMQNRRRVIAPNGANSTAAGKVNSDPRVVTATPATDIEPEAVSFLWERRIPTRALSLIAGEGGLGKSTLTMEIAARLSRGQLDGEFHGRPVDVLLVSVEDAAANVVIPRLIAADAALERVHVLRVEVDGYGGLLSLADDLPRIETKVQEIGAKVLVVDPIVATLGKIDSHKDQEVRSVLAPVAQLAERQDLAVIGVIHLSKGESRKLLERVSGSVGFVNAARSVLAFARDPGDDQDHGVERVLLHAKSNWGRYAPGLAYRIESATIDGAIETSRLVYVGESDVRSEDLIGGEEAHLARDEAEEFLAEALAGGEWHPSAVVKEDARKKGHSRRTLTRARERLKVLIREAGFPARTEWRLPVGPPPREGAGTTEGGPTEQTRIVEPNTGDSGSQWGQPSGTGPTGAGQGLS